jgi:hypothetical protein
MQSRHKVTVPVATKKSKIFPKDPPRHAHEALVCVEEDSHRTHIQVSIPRRLFDDKPIQPINTLFWTIKEDVAIYTPEMFTEEEEKSRKTAGRREKKTEKPPAWVFHPGKEVHFDDEKIYAEHVAVYYQLTIIIHMHNRPLLIVVPIQWMLTFV